MKEFRILAIFILIFLVNNANAQEKDEINLADSTGLPGDNFSLQGALGLFKESKSLEDFEKQLNSKDNAVNNLDLNGDGKTDYVRVVDISKDQSHAIVLQVPVTQTETQDVAVIELEKDGEASAVVQIVGDEELYAKNTIVEPAEITEPSDKGNSKSGPDAFSPGAVIIVNVWGWPCVRYIYSPIYIGWVSPWYWGFYPVWWSPWAPYPWRYHYMHCHHYHHYYHYAPYHRTTYAHGVYAPRRTYSAQVNKRYQENHVRYNANASNRPRTGAVNSGRPQQTTQPSSRPQSRPQTKPATKSGTQQLSKPSSRPQTAPQSRPQSKPATQPGKQQYSKPSSKPQSSPSSRPQTKPASQPGKQQMKPASKPGQVSRPANQSRPAQNSKPAGGKSK